MEIKLLDQVVEVAWCNVGQLDYMKKPCHLRKQVFYLQNPSKWTIECFRFKDWIDKIKSSEIVKEETRNHKTLKMKTKVPK